MTDGGQGDIPLTPTDTSSVLGLIYDDNKQPTSWKWKLGTLLTNRSKLAIIILLIVLVAVIILVAIIVNRPATPQTAPADYSFFCDDNPCGEHGLCRTHKRNGTIVHASCVCDPGFTGSRCTEADSEHMKRFESPCGKFGNFHVVQRSGDILTAKCVCDEGFAGEYCEKELGACHEKPCVSNPECYDRLGRYLCRCVSEAGRHVCQREYDVQWVGKAVSPTLGHVQFRRYGSPWGRICVDGLGASEASAICRTLGYHRGSSAYDIVPALDEALESLYLDGLSCPPNAIHLYQCSHGGWNATNCDGSKDMRITCTENVYELRLQGGTSVEGRVEIRETGGIWGTICDNGFYKTHADIICKMLGFRRGSVHYRRSAYFGRGTGPVYLRYMYCPPNVDHLDKCRLNWRPNSCSHSEDVGIECKPNNYVVRLAGGSDASEGRLEVRTVNGDWGTVCDKSFELNDTYAICLSLGFSDHYAEVFRGAHFGQGNGSVLLEKPNCPARASFLESCNITNWGLTSCTHAHDVGISCSVDRCESSPCLFGRCVRDKSNYTCECFYGYSGRNCDRKKYGLHFESPETNASEGVVKIRHALARGEWGTVCSNGITDNELNLLCVELGFYRGSMGLNESLGYGNATSVRSEPVHLEGLRCPPHATHLDQCTHHGWDVGNCTSKQPVAVKCITNKFEARLANGSKPYEGRLEVRLAGGQWGTVGDDYFGLDTCNIFCRMLGFHRGCAKVWPRAYFGRGKDKRILDDVKCPRGAIHMEQCTWRVDNSLTHYEDVGVTCVPLGVDVRLVGGSIPSEGRVELRSGDGTWKTVCDKKFGLKEANMVCNMLNYPIIGARVWQGAHFGEGTGDVEQMNCIYSDYHLEQCMDSGWNDNNCTHKNDVGVTCDIDECKSNPCVHGLCQDGHLTHTCICQLGYTGASCQQKKYEVKLVNGTATNEGIVQIRKAGKDWGGVCSNGFDGNQGNVLCKMLGFYRGFYKVVTNLTLDGDNPVTIHMGKLECPSKAVHVDQCEHPGWGVSNCTDGRPVAVTCIPNDYDVRLANGPTKHEGIVEIRKHGDNVWGSVCGRSYSTFVSHIFCYMLGAYRAASRTIHKSYSELGEGPVYLETVGCSAGAKSLEQCTYTRWESRYCARSSRIGISCSNIVYDVRLVDGPNPKAGRVEVRIPGGPWGTICGTSGSRSNIARTICVTLGFSSSYRYIFHEHAHFGEGQGPIHMSNLTCDKSNGYLEDCRHAGWGVANCTHKQDISVSCETSNFCANNPCQNGVCSSIHSYSARYWCTCFHGYTGKNCELQSRCRVTTVVSEW